MVKIYLDDIRTPIGKDWIIVRSYDEFINKLIELDFKVSLISLDHDLGDSAMQEWYNNTSKNFTLDYNNITEKTGYDCAKWLVEQWMNGKPSCEVVVHSANAIGSGNIMGYINNYKHINKLAQDCIRVRIKHTI